MQGLLLRSAKGFSSNKQFSYTFSIFAFEYFSVPGVISAVEQFNDIPYFLPPNLRPMFCVIGVLLQNVLIHSPKLGNLFEVNQSYIC